MHCPLPYRPRFSPFLLTLVLVGLGLGSVACGSDEAPPPVPALPEDGPPPTGGAGVPDVVAPEREEAMGMGEAYRPERDQVTDHLGVGLEAVTAEVEEGSHPDALFFQGVLPCADCAGIRTKLTLLPGPRVYVLRETYLGVAGGGDATFTILGRWGEEPGVLEAVPTAAVIRLDGEAEGPPRAYLARLDRDTLRLLDREGLWIDSDLPYELRRVEEF